MKVHFCDFGLFSDICEDLSEQFVENDKYLFEYMPNLAENNDNSSTISELIENCNRETVERLMDYFEPEAPIQQILKKRLSDLRRQDHNDIYGYLDEQKKNTQSFYSYLVTLMEKKGFSSDADFYNYIGMSRQTFAKLRKANAGISRNHVLLMAVGLGLNYNEAVAFMEKAGYCFNGQNKREAIISYVMRNEDYDLMKMEDILFSFNEKTLIDY